MFRIFATIVFAFSLPFPIFSATPEMAILPFTTTGQSDDLQFTEQEFPELLMEASHFIIGVTRNHRLQALDITRSAVKKSGWQPDRALNEVAVSSLCRETQATRLFAGTAQFLAAGRVTISASVIACSSKKEIARAQRIGSMRNIQALLRDVARDATPFAAEKPNESIGTGKPVDLVIVLDASGSMREDYLAVVKSLRGVRDSLPMRSRIGVIVVAPEGLDVMGLTESWDRTITALEKKNPAGDVSMKQIEDALAMVEASRDWQNQRRLLLFFDAPGGGRRMSGVETRLRRLLSKGVEVNLFQVAGQDASDKKELRRISNALRLTDPSVSYGVRVGFLEGFSAYLIQSGSKFFRADRDVTNEIASGTLNLEGLLPIETIHYTAEELTIKNLPRAYAKHENLRFSGMGPVISGLENRISKAAGSSEGGVSASRIMLKHNGKAFWIRASAGEAQHMKKWKGQTIYIGLSFSRDANDLANVPERVYPLKQGDVPRLFITTRENLLRGGGLSREDVHFLLCEVLEIAGPDGEDIRK